MDSLRQIGAGFLLAIISISLVFGGFVLSVAEGGKGSLPISATPSLPVIELSQATPTQINGAPATAVTEQLTLAATPTSTLPPTPASCVPPVDWVAITVQTSDTLETLVQTYQTTAGLIKTANCLFSDQLVVGSYLYVPPIATATSAPCGAPAGWMDYRVVAGDTLYTIGLRYGVTVAALQSANCLNGSTYIHVGQLLKVPNVVPVPLVTWTSIPTQTTVPFETETPVPPTDTLPTDIPVETNTLVPVDTLVPTAVTPGYP